MTSSSASEKMTIQVRICVRHGASICAIFVEREKKIIHHFLG